MQDHRHRLNRDRKGVMDLPIKLMVIMIVITVSVPLLTDALDDNQEKLAYAEMQQEVSKIMNAAVLAHYSGNGSARTVEVELPAGCEISIGGEGSDAYSMRSMYNGKVVSTDYFERPVIKVENNIVVAGHVTLMLRNIDCGNVSGMEVTVI